MNYKHYALYACLLSLFAVSCSDEILNGLTSARDAISLTGVIDQDYVTRATDDGFANGDQMGVFIVDYDGTSSGKLAPSGNRANNAMFQFDSETSRWICATQFYWKDDSTPIDVYGYYPYKASITDVNDYSFTVEADQSAGVDGSLGGYEKSDFLWAKATEVSPTRDAIKLTYQHRMAGVQVTLKKGEGITDTEWVKVAKLVTVDNTSRLASIDLSTGVVTMKGEADKSIMMCPQGADVWRAVVVPQTVAEGTKFIGITIDETSYHYTRTAKLDLASGKLHRFTLTIDKKQSGDYSLNLESEEITAWENDNVTHGFFDYEYTVVTTTEPGTLKQTIEKMGKDYAQIKNLKIVGPITNTDFEFMCNEMSVLAMLNMKEALLKGWTWYEWDIPHEEADNYIPAHAFHGKNSLRRIIFPDNLERIGECAFTGIGLDANSIISLPPSLKRVDNSAFASNGYAGELVLNDSLEYIGDRAFAATRFVCELNIPSRVKHIGGGAFAGFDADTHIYNTAKHFQLPEDLEYLGEGAFSGVEYDEVGEIIIPKFMTEVTRGSFPGFTRGVKVTFHDGVKKIMNAAFYGGTRFINHISLPEGLTTIEGNAFMYCDFTAGLSLPSTLRVLEGNCLSAGGVGDLVLPEGIVTVKGLGGGIKSCVLPSTCEVIGNDCFAASSLRTIKINKECSYICHRAFHSCGELRTVICLNPEPPTLQDYSSNPSEANPFGNLNFDQVVLEVPERSVELYRNTPGWNQFRFITAYHELAVGASELKCLDKGLTYETLVRAEGSWEVAECPSWCHVSPKSSDDRRTEITIKVDPTTPGTERDGRIVFKLKNADYSTYTTVTQSAFEHAQDSEIILQTASAGGKEIPVFLVGEGFDAPSIIDGTYMQAMNEAYASIFAIEPFKSYRDYFTVSTAVAVSPDAGMATVQNMAQNLFDFSSDDFGMHIDFSKIKDYARKVSTHVNSNPGNALVIVVPNFNAFFGMTHNDNDGCAIAVCGYSRDEYPYDFRGTVQHYALGGAFGHLASENIAHNTFLKTCTCPGCSSYNDLKAGQANGWYQNISISGGMNSVPWKHLVFNPSYSDIVDVFEGAWGHQRGVYRSENMSVMNTYIQYFNTWSRELLVRRIMELAGKPFSFDDFVGKDSREGEPVK